MKNFETVLLSLKKKGKGMRFSLSFLIHPDSIGISSQTLVLVRN
jgi:hypothetical protein